MREASRDDSASIIALYQEVRYCAALYSTVLYCAVFYCTVLCCAVLCCAVVGYAVLHHTVVYCAVLYLLYCTYCAVHYCAVLTVLCCTELHHTTLYCTELHHTILCYTTLLSLNDFSHCYSYYHDLSVYFILSVDLPNRLIHIDRSSEYSIYCTDRISISHLFLFLFFSAFPL